MMRVFLRCLLTTLIVSAGAYFYYHLPNVAELKLSNPKVTALMLLRDRENKKKQSRPPANLGRLRLDLGTSEAGRVDQ